MSLRDGQRYSRIDDLPHRKHRQSPLNQPRPVVLQVVSLSNELLISILLHLSVAQEWSPCTRQCDTGVAARDMVCGTTVANQEVEFCKVSDCPGCGLRLTSLSDLLWWLLASVILFKPLTHILFMVIQFGHPTIILRSRAIFKLLPPNTVIFFTNREEERDHFTRASKGLFNQYARTNYRHRRRLWGEPGHAPPIIRWEMGANPFCPTVIR